MNTALAMLIKTALFVALMIPGFLLGKTQRLSFEAVPSLGNLLTDVAMPALVFSKLITLSDCGLTVAEIGCAILLPLIVLSALFFLSRFLFRKKVNGRVMAFCAVFPNCGFLGIPLASELYPDRPEIAICVSISNVVVTTLLLTLGIFLLSEDRTCIRPGRILISPLTVSVVLGLLLSLTGWGDSVPWLETFASYLAQLTTPLAMVVLGYEFAIRQGKITKNIRNSLLPTALKLLFAPILGLAILLLLKAIGIPVDDVTVCAIILTLAVPAAASAPAMSARYQCDGSFAADLTVLETCLSLVTLPLLECLSKMLF